MISSCIWELYEKLPGVLNVILQWVIFVWQVCTLLCRTIYERLASAFVDEMKEVYLKRVDEISPNIRYCAYSIGDETAIKDLMQMRMRSSGAGDTLTTRLDVSKEFSFTWFAFVRN